MEELIHEFPDRQQRIVCFSGGIDACYTVYEHYIKNRGRRNVDIATGILIHGFDIPLSDENRFKRAASDFRAILS